MKISSISNHQPIQHSNVLEDSYIKTICSVISEKVNIACELKELQQLDQFINEGRSYSDIMDTDIDQLRGNKNFLKYIHDLWEYIWNLIKSYGGEVMHDLWNAVEI